MSRRRRNSSKRTQTYHRNTTTKVCLHFITGSCNYGSKCKFLHGDVPDQPNRSKQTKKPTTKNCSKSSIDRTNRPKQTQTTKKKLTSIQRRPRRSRHFKKYAASQHAPKDKDKAATKQQPQPSLNEILCDDNLVEILLFLEVKDLGLVAACCSKWNELQSISKSSISLWQHMYAHNLFPTPSKQWSMVLKSSCPPPTQKNNKAMTTPTTNNWKVQVRDRTAQQHRWLKEAHYDHAVHSPDRQQLHVGCAQEFSTIQDAVRVASAFDQIIVHPGDYSDEKITLRVSVEIIGAPAPAPAPAATPAAPPPPPPPPPPSIFGSPISITSLPEDLNPIASIARKAVANTFAAILGKIYIYPGTKSRFSSVAFGGEDSVISFNEIDETRRMLKTRQRKTFCEFDECSFKSTLFVFENKSVPQLGISLHRCILINCDSVLMGAGGGGATLRPFGLDLPRLEDEESAEEVAQHVARFVECCGLP